MPSNKKKRQAAKKKNEEVPNIHPTTNSQGSYDVRTHDEKESDSGEISSPASQDPHQPLEEKEEVVEVDSSVGLVVVADSNAMEGSQNGAGDDDGEGEIKQMVEVVQVSREMKLDEDSESKIVSIEYVQNEKDLGFVGLSGDAGNSSSSSGSDDEFPLADKNSLVIESGKLEEEEGDGAVMETVQPLDSDEPVVSLSEEVTEVVEDTTVANTGVSHVIDLVSKEEEMKLQSHEIAGSSGVIDLVSKENEEEVSGTADAPAVEISDGGERYTESEITGSSENQPQLVLAPPIVQPTSWKSCCGLFDVLRRSNR